MTKSIRKAWLEAAPSTATAVSFQSAEASTHTCKQNVGSTNGRFSYQPSRSKGSRTRRATIGVIICLSGCEI